MNTEKVKKFKRYPGVSPFTSQQRKVFFGRDEDIKNFKKLVLLRNQTLLYSSSGIGKTSLLQAGIIPELIERFNPLFIRFTAYNEKQFVRPLERIVEILKNYLKEDFQFDLERWPHQLDNLFQGNKYEKTLWYYFKKVQLSNQCNKKFILVFDQFEELFSYPEEMIMDFKIQLAELTRVAIPDMVISEIYTQNTEEHTQNELTEELVVKIDLKTVFSIRSDRLSLLNELKDRIPDIQEVFYELKPLNYEQVEKAIVKPADKVSDQLESKPYNYLPESINKIINELSDGRSQTIDTTQLQIVCQQIEEIVIKKQLNRIDDGKRIEIKPDDLPEFKAIFFTFYDSSIKKLTKEKQALARRLIEDELVRNGVRISLDEIFCKEKLDESDLNILVNTHLLRADRNNFGRFSYELSHDTLVKPIVETQKNYLEKLEEEKTQKEQQEKIRIANEKVKKERIEREKDRKRQQKVIVIVSIAAVISLSFAIFGIVMWQKSKKTLDELKQTQFTKLFEDADRLKNSARYDEAIEKYKDADSLISYLKIRDSIEICKGKVMLKPKFENGIAQIDSLVNKDRYFEAILLADTLKSINYDPKTINTKTDEIKAKGSAFYFIRAKEFYFSYGNKETAKQYIDKALKLEPNKRNILLFKETYLTED